MPVAGRNPIKFIEQNLKVVSSGIAAATVKGKDFVPHADLALSQAITEMYTPSAATAGMEDAKQPFPVVELTRDEALDFLSKEPLTFEKSPNGYLLLTYKGIPLGFVKNLGNRSNNLWPQARRIRMAH